jgi:hypothetical protein
MWTGNSLAAQDQAHLGAEAKGQACPNNDSGLKLPAGFCATVFADGIGHARHMVVAPSGVLYVNTSGRAENAKLPGAGIIPKQCPMERVEGIANRDGL